MGGVFKTRPSHSLFRAVALLLLPLVALTSCCRVASTSLEPRITPPSHPREGRSGCPLLPLPADYSSLSPFVPLTEVEAQEEWGKEYRIGLAFAAEFDLYRAITAFKRALYLLPPLSEREPELQYAVVLSYYLGKKYPEVVSLISSTSLATVESTFPAFSDLLLVLYDSYRQVGGFAQAEALLPLLERTSSGQKEKLQLLHAVECADFSYLRAHGYDAIVTGYCRSAKSVRAAQTFNALLPGAGYWYVGLRQTAVTALLVNALFIGAATQLLLDHQGVAATILFSFEGGWYFGGITGAGLAAKQYNEQLYGSYADKILQREKPFPCLMLKYSF